MEKSAMLATYLSERLQIRGKPDLAVVAGMLGLEVREVGAETFEGALVRAAGRRGGIIAVRATIPEPGRRRFTIAHEIGHYVLPGHDQLPACLPDSLECWGSGLPATELDANEFASELLLPTRYVRPLLASGHPDLAKIERTATEYETSLTATTRKFLQLTDHVCAMVWSTAGVSRWYQRSEACTVFIRTGPLDPGSKAANLFRGGQREKPQFEEVCSDVWLSPPGDETVDRVLECSVFLKNYDSVLTLLWIEDVIPLRSESDELLEELDPNGFTLDRNTWPKK